MCMEINCVMNEWTGGNSNPKASCVSNFGLPTCNVMFQMVEEGSTLLRRMEISVAEAEKRSGKNSVNMQETFTVYLIETR